MKIIQQHNHVPAASAGIEEHWKTTAMQLEKQADNQAAIEIYENQLKHHPLEAYVYDRLMILYRREKEYKKELVLINTAIEKFKTLLQPSSSSQSRKIATLSRSILAATGLTDKKGHPLYYPQPISKWEKRKQHLRNKISRKKK